MSDRPAPNRRGFFKRIFGVVIASRVEVPAVKPPRPQLTVNRIDHEHLRRLFDQWAFFHSRAVEVERLQPKPAMFISEVSQ